MFGVVVTLAVGAGACKRSQPQPVPAPPQARVEPPAAVLGDLMQIVGGVRIRHLDGTEEPAAPGSLRPGDRLVTQEGGRAILRMVGGPIIEISEGARVGFAGEGRSFSLEVIEGIVVARMADGESQTALGGDRITFTMVGGIEIKRGPGPQSTASEDGDEDGEGDADGDGKDNPAPAAGARLPAAPRAVLVLPAVRGVRVYGDRLRQVSLTWSEPIESARVEVARDARFSHTVVAGIAGGSYVNVAPPKSGALFWRVKDESGRVRQTGNARFVPDRGSSLLDLKPARGIINDTGHTATVYYQSSAPAVTFAWTAQPGASRYRLRVYAAEALTLPVVEKTVAGTRCALEAGTLSEGDYVWHATPLDADGRAVTGGRMNKLTIVYDNATIKLAVATPGRKDGRGGGRLELRGVAPQGNQVFVNGQATPVDAKGRFQLSVRRQETLVFKLVGKDGRESFWVRNLKARS